jgi:hypothetical protein
MQRRLRRRWVIEEVSGGAELNDRPRLLEAVAAVEARCAAFLIFHKLDHYHRARRQARPAMASRASCAYWLRSPRNRRRSPKRGGQHRVCGSSSTSRRSPSSAAGWADHHGREPLRWPSVNGVTGSAGHGPEPKSRGAARGAESMRRCGSPTAWLTNTELRKQVGTVAHSGRFAPITPRSARRISL